MRILDEQVGNGCHGIGGRICHRCCGIRDEKLSRRWVNATFKGDLQLACVVVS
jgi:hypothetical protein